MYRSSLDKNVAKNFLQFKQRSKLWNQCNVASDVKLSVHIHFGAKGDILLNVSWCTNGGLVQLHVCVSFLVFGADVTYG